MTRLLSVVALALVLALPAAAQAAYFPGQQVDGPTADIVDLGGVALSRDSDGHVLYRKREAGADHVFVSFLSAGNPGPPRRLDTGQTTSSSQARISSSDNERAVAVWVNRGSLWASVRASASSDWSPPEAVYSVTPTGPPVTQPSLSMGPSGAAYVAFEVGGDLRVARLGGTNWTLIPDALDIEAARGVSDVEIATSADGTALAAWTEAGHVFVRRVIRTRLSQVPREVGVPDLEGRAGGLADSPALDIEDDSSYAWVAIRQDFDGGSRVFARRLVGSEFDPPVTIDAGVFGAEAPVIDMTGRGRGLSALTVRGSRAIIGAGLGADDEWDPATQLTGGAPVAPTPASALGENGRGTVAYHESGAVLARHWNARTFEDPVALSESGLGAVDSGAGLDASADSHGNAAAAWVQGGGSDRRVMVAVFDREPRAVGGQNFDKWTRKRSFTLDWNTVDDPWGAVQYRLEVDGLPVTTTTRTAAAVRDLPDGAHVWSVVSIDSRGQETEGPGRALYVDTNAPTVELVARRSRVTLSARDGDEAMAGSGVASVKIRYGDGRRGQLRVPRIGVIEDAQLGGYRRPGRYTVRVEVRDRAGNRRVQTARVVVGR